MKKKNQNLLYFDYAAATPVDRHVVAAMRPYFSERFGNAGSLHFAGQEAIAAVDRARQTVASFTGVSFDGVVFTGSATEANNLAVLGAIHFWRSQNPGKLPRIIVSAIEHDSVLAPARFLQESGLVDLVSVPVDSTGVVDLEVLKNSLTPETVLVSVMYGNNEMGTIQPIAKIATIIRNFREQVASVSYPFFHTDAAQAGAYLSCNMSAFGVDMLTLSSQKVYGPKGVGALCLARSVFCVPTFGQIVRKPAITPVLFGGGQEQGLRSGTENVPGIVGFAKALQIAASMQKKEVFRVRVLKEYFWKKFHTLVSGAQVIGPTLKKEAISLPHIISLCVSGEQTAQDILTRLDLAGIAASSGSACSARAFTVSHVATAIGLTKEEAMRTLRFSFGRQTTKKEIDVLVKKLAKIVRV